MFQRTLRETRREKGQNTVPISMAGHLQYLLIIVKVVALRKVPFSDRQNSEAVS